MVEKVRLRLASWKKKNFFLEPGGLGLSNPPLMSSGVTIRKLPSFPSPPLMNWIEFVITFYGVKMSERIGCT